ncbi:hypothetical protein FD723_40265 (plasmid) [Nostoc sp. C052]|uniref:hypothetical protein n=1 Tax=Nostoc sp. C052 TaxID=2576902 RepID=UPI0015C33F75|nr:hypothetical protein [Nostoc sp. C052]QLE46449.1 hypothetical protein FD723_40265 [Nostoc sp. C052]
MTTQDLIDELKPCFLKHNELYKLSLLKQWAFENNITYLEQPLRRSGDNWMAVFPRTYDSSYQVFVHKQGKSLEVSAI